MTVQKGLFCALDKMRYNLTRKIICQVYLHNTENTNHKYELNFKNAG